MSSRVLVSVVLAVMVSLMLGTGLTALAIDPLPGTEWEKTYGGTGNDYAESVQQTTDGGYIIAGYTSSYGIGGDIYLVKTDSTGNTEQENYIGGSDTQQAYSVQQTTDGGYIICGITYGGAGYTDFYLVKTGSSLAVVEWEKKFGGTGRDYAYSVQQTTDGGYIIGGTSSSYNSGDYDLYLAKTDSSGNITWAKTFGGSGWDSGFSAIQTTDGGYLIAGVTDTGSPSWENVYLVKTDSSGNVEWENNIGGTNDDYAYAVQQTEDGGYILAGETYSDKTDSYDFYLVKTDASGNKEWDKIIGGTGYERAHSVRQTADGGYIVAGMTESYAAGYTDFYLVKTDASGNIQWEKTIGGIDYSEEAYSVQQTTDGGYILAGEKRLYEAGPKDVYLVKVYTDINTPVGEDVTISLSNGTVSFPSVSENGTTAMTTSTENPVDPTPSDFYVLGENFVGITTTATYSGLITVGITYDDTGIPDEGSLHLFHYNGSAWVDATTYVDTVNNIIYGEVDSLSPFFIGWRVANANGPYIAAVGTSIVFDGAGSHNPPGGTLVSYNWDFGDNTTGYGVVTIHTYTAVGIYDVVLTVTDNTGVQYSDTTMAVAYDPAIGSASGGGWFWSDPDNLKSNPESEGRATFGFIAKYRQGSAEGYLGFRYHAGDINLRSDEISWLVISGVNAQFQGEGTINGEGLYTFRVLAKDGDLAGGQPDEFTIKIWEGTDTEAEPIYKALNVELGGGNIIIHDN